MPAILSRGRWVNSNLKEEAKEDKLASRIWFHMELDDLPDNWILKKWLE